MQDFTKIVCISVFLTIGITIVGYISNVESIFAQSLESEVVNSIYLTITDQRFRDGDFSDQITGVIVNNSTEEIGSVQVFAAFYDSTGNLITIENGYADVSPLSAGDNSAFSISLFGLDDENPSKYVLYAAGLPSAF